MNRQRVDGTTANSLAASFLGHDRMAGLHRANPGAPRCRQIWIRAWGRMELADERTGRRRSPLRGEEQAVAFSRVGWASGPARRFRIDDAELPAPPWCAAGKATGATQDRATGATQDCVGGKLADCQ